MLEGKTDKHDEYVYGAQTTRGIISGSECYPIRSIRSETYHYIRNLNYKAAFHNIVQTARSKDDYWVSWLEKAKTDPAAAKMVNAYMHRPAEELYDIVKDPYELNNLADDRAHAKIKADLSKRLDAWMVQQGDKGNATEMDAKNRQGKGKKSEAKGKPRKKAKG